MITLGLAQEILKTRLVRVINGVCIWAAVFARKLNCIYTTVGCAAVRVRACVRMCVRTPGRLTD